VISFGGKAQLTSYITPTQKERNKMVSKRSIGARKRGKKKNAKNTNPGGHEVVRATIPAANLEFLHKFLNLWTSLSRTLRGRGKPREG
jgi:hypothetical protein